MRVLVAHGSSKICDRIIGTVTEVPNTEVIRRDSHWNPWIEDFTDDRPDVAILDAESNPVNGIAMMKSMKVLSNSPVVIMTSNVPYRQYRRECLKQGADYFFYLPDEIEQLAGAIKALAEVVHQE